ncbi:MAG: hypothetical protein WEC59_02655 [Salibacteraceae bacterium]
MFLELLRIIGFVLFSSVKFLFAPSTVYLSGYSYFETIAITITGGVIGVLVFFYTGAKMFAFLNERFKRSRPKKAFSRRNRMLIKLKSSWGLIGLAVLSPSFISIPFGSLIAAKYFRHDKRTMPLMLAAVVFWSITLTSLTALIGPLFD